jgi:tetratricopeptide (TPR) repeat protein
MSSHDWNEFPFADSAFEYSGTSLMRAWARLHQGDCEPFPDAARVKALLKATPGLADGLEEDLRDNPKALAEALQSAWRHYHAGQFQKAYEDGVALGPLGAVVAAKAAGIYATYLEDDEEFASTLFLDAAERAEEASRIMRNEANTHYQRAYNLGRYSQAISIAKALTQGLAGKVKDSLETVLSLSPEHAEANTALAMFHCEVISSVGSVVGGLTYGAKRDAAIRLFDRSLALHPESAIAHMEYGNGLLLLFGDKREDEVVELYEKAAACEPADAMEKLDIEQARAELE